RFTYPGGCDIGKRPIDLHLKGLKMLGADIGEDDGHLICAADKLTGNHIILGYPSVGATENIMLAAVMAQGKTVITNAAREPEIWDLQCFINKMGGKVSGAGTSIITIEGVDRLHEVHHSIIPDRIVAGTYMAASAITGGDIVLDNINAEHMAAIIEKYKDMGCDVLLDGDSLYVKGPHRIHSVDITTLPYPGFPTDMQAITMAVLTKADGISRIVETVFENRFRHVNDLIAMGADIMLCDKTAIIKGVQELKGAEVKAKDLRGGAALIVAALAASGVTLIDDIYFVDRGYEGICDVLNNLGADVSIVS
ncbi:MAG: UDP-N-acetylglucosamine 1-carboxyvinyltransferase, partial [Clostridiales bacterium]|nr:UDP-N-acetylglucosamine 1-carboxyvinyltransferase [Clostridiales bacterium]